jgi:hypothetical protein
VYRIAVAVALLAGASLLASCGSEGSSTQQTSSSPSTVAPSTSEATAATTTTSAAGSAATTTAPSSVTSDTSAPGAAISAEDAQAIRDLAFKFWAAYNAYDPDTAVSYLDESYRTAKEQTIRDEIGRIKSFGVQLGMSEKTAPTLTGTDQAEMSLNMKEPIGTRTILMKFAKQGDAWIITYSEEAK